MKNNIVVYQESDLRTKIHMREGEQKLGEKLVVMKLGEGLENLIQYVNRGITYVLLGIPESVGPMANYGKCCTDHAWSAFLYAFLNMHSNQFLAGDNILCLGHVDTGAINTEAGLLDK